MFILPIRCRDEMTKMDKLDRTDENKADAVVESATVSSVELTEEVIRSLQKRVLDKSSSAFYAW